MEDLQDWVADPQGFIDRRLETVIILSDQIPFWVKIGKLRVLMAAWESGKKLKKQYKDCKIKSSSDAQTQVTQQVEELIEGVRAEQTEELLKEGQTQTRGPGFSSQDKFRITFEARQVVLHWFDTTKDPLGVIEMTLLVVPTAAHARLSNIDDDHKWIETESFEVAGLDEPVVHTAGQKTACLTAFVELRKQHPELFENLVVMGQPSGTFDEVIAS